MVGQASVTAVCVKIVTVRAVRGGASERHRSMRDVRLVGNAAVHVTRINET